MRIERQIGDQIRLLRTLHGIPLDALADIVGIRPDRLHEIEDGLERASAELLVNIAETVGVAPSYFFQLIVAPAHDPRT